MRLLVLFMSGLLLVALLLRDKPSAIYAAAVTVVITMLGGAIMRGLAGIIARQYSPLFRVLQPLRRQKQRAGNAQFFRSPPQWQDFEQLYVVPRTEMAELVAAVRQKSRGVFLIEGHPASGKTVLARYTEYTLLVPRLGFWRPLFRIEAKQLTPGDSSTLYTELDDIPDRAVVIIDDIHLLFEVFADVAERFAERKIVFVYISRPLSNLPTGLTERFRYQVSHTWELSSTTVARRIVVAYLSRDLRMSADTITTTEAVFAPYSADLWVLGAALKTFKDYGHPAAAFRSEISRWVREHVLARSPTIEPAGRAKRAGALAVAAALYQFEIPVDRRFLQSIADIDDDGVAAMLRAFDLQEQSVSAFALYHSSYAKLILGALASADGLGLVPALCFGAAAAQQLDPIHWPDAVITKHLNDVHGRTIMDLAILSAATAERRDMVVEVFRGVSDGAIDVALNAQLTPSIQAVGALLQLFLIARRQLADGTKTRLSAYARSAEGRTDAWAWATENAARLDRALAGDFVQPLAQRLATETARVIAGIATTLSYADPTVAQQALARVDPQTLARKAAAECKGLLDLAVVIAKLVWVRPDWIGAYFDLFNRKSAGATTQDFGHAISRIAWGSSAAAAELLRALPPTRLADIVSRGNSDHERTNALGILATIAPETAMEVCNGLTVTEADGLLTIMMSDIRRTAEAAWRSSPGRDTLKKTPTT